MANGIVTGLRRLAWNLLGPPPSDFDDLARDFRPIHMVTKPGSGSGDGPRSKLFKPHTRRWTEGATYRFPGSVERVRFVKQASTEVIGSGEITSKGI